MLVNAELSFTFNSSFDIRTISSRGASSGNDVTGLLYVPTLDDSSPCINATEPYIPQNVTRRANLPPDDYNLVALAPWVSGECSLEYMEVARQDPTKAILFFLPGTSGVPPESSDPQWDIARAGVDNWKAQNGFPVYAVNGQSGATLMNASAAYSGNMTDVPNGHLFTEYYPSRDYVRLHADINTGMYIIYMYAWSALSMLTSTGNGTSLPSLWVFLLVVLGILLSIIGITSLSMHLLQRRRRANLRKRVERGEVDLEALGIKRLTVPREQLDTMPLYAYGTTPIAARGVVATDGLIDIEKEGSPTQTEQVRPTLAPRSSSYHPDALSQPTCAICLDDFVPFTSEEEGTKVRELPCHHIFHPECVDTFLQESSSLCPMCKKSVLPVGYCPRVITNAMVRRERLLRQARERAALDPESRDDIIPYYVSERFRSLPGFRQYWASRRESGLPPTSQPMTQLNSHTAPTSTSTQAPVSTELARPPVQPPATSDHRSWARQRAENMLGRRAPVDPEAEEARTTPAWRKAIRGLFPRQ